jgi:hypothetical protein
MKGVHLSDKILIFKLQNSIYLKNMVHANIQNKSIRLSTINQIHPSNIYLTVTISVRSK